MKLDVVLLSFALGIMVTVMLPGFPWVGLAYVITAVILTHDFIVAIAKRVR
jgi:hypothetical protein